MGTSRKTKNLLLLVKEEVVKSCVSKSERRHESIYGSEYAHLLETYSKEVLSHHQNVYKAIDQLYLNRDITDKEMVELKTYPFNKSKPHILAGILNVIDTAISWHGIVVTRKSQLSGKKHSYVLDVTPEQLQKISDPERTELIQLIVPKLDADEREFLITGATPEEWASQFPS